MKATSLSLSNHSAAEKAVNLKKHFGIDPQ